ncbi:NepR family anti-sigma factor [Oceaniglobus ichthyenteri]|nr:NepR family anti-sigma factor [Oceaniglobus ichthyenteri]
MTRHKDTSDLMKQIDENLRRVYQETDKTEVPDRFKDLLDKLRTQDTPND